MFVDIFKSGEQFALPIYKPSELKTLPYGTIYYTTTSSSGVKAQLLKMGIDEKKIVPIDPVCWLRKWKERRSLQT